MKCTWKDCDQEATVEQLNVHAKPWAHLCPKHNQEFEENVHHPDVREALKVWSLANGGADKVAKMMVKDLNNE